VLAAPGLRTVYYRALEKEFSAYYERASDPSVVKWIKISEKTVYEVTLHFVMPDPSAMVERLVAPESITLTVGDIAGSGTFSYAVHPGTASQNVRATVTPLTGNAYIAGNMIYATAAGTVRLRVASAVDSTVYAEQTVHVYPPNIIGFADGSLLWDGENYIAAY
jgi:hypothetical protein